VGWCLLSCTQAGAAAAVRRHKTAATSAEKKPATPKAAGAAALLAVAQRELEAGHLAVAAEYANSAAVKAPLLEDYAQFVRAQAEYRLKDYGETAKAVTEVLSHTPTSPLTGAAAALAVSAELDNNSAKPALDLIRKYYNNIPQPQAELLLAKCFQASGDLAQAAEHFQGIYYGYPSAKEASDAATALVGLKQQLGDAYPPPLARAMIERARKLFQDKNPAAARIELAAAIPQLGGSDRDLARVRLGVADYYAGKEHDASAYLLALRVDDPEADAERLSYLIRCARKPDRHADVKPFLNQLEQQHAASPWRLDALIFVADQARTDNDPGTFIPLYRACATTFASDPRSAWCHWQIAFDAYRHDTADAGDLLRKHISQHPESTDVNDALYFLGRLSERKNENGSAKACYEELGKLFPNTYYAVVARERLKTTSLEAATADEHMSSFLEGVNWPPRPEFPSFTPGPTAKVRLERADLLRLASLNDLAEGELKFGARSEGEQPNVYALELAALASARNAPDQAMRYIKAYAPGYLYMPLDQAPVQFWRYAFPIPYRAAIEQNSRSQSLDPFLVAALIRQESEFNAGVISHANAYGLMQLLPATGKQLARQVRIRRFTTRQLLTPERNIQLGTMFFHNLLNSYGGQAELALASYNAGPGRASLWKTWGPFREPAEFIETVPFHETRGYIQIVLRNADVYRRLYSGTMPDVPPYRPKPAPKKSTGKTLRRKRSS
jgi:soluble lytic murein transglycosylase